MATVLSNGHEYHAISPKIGRLHALGAHVRSPIEMNILTVCTDLYDGEILWPKYCEILWPKYLAVTNCALSLLKLQHISNI